MALLPSPVLAHARWFIDDTKISAASFSFDAVYAVILAGATLFVVGAMCLEYAAARIEPLRTVLFDRLPIPFDLDWRVLSSALGAVLLATSFTEMVLAPNLRADGSSLDLVLLATQAAVGALFLFETRLRLAGALTLALPLVSIVAFSPLKVVDYVFEFVGVGLAFWIVAPQLSAKAEAAVRHVRPSRLKRNNDGARGISIANAKKIFQNACAKAARQSGERGIEAASILRTMLGTQLIILAAHDKIFEPGVTLAFVEKYPFVNVPALLGIDAFSNLHFVFGAGMAEIVFGLLLVTNTAARLVAAMLAGLFTLTGLIFGLHEMLGHMPILFSLVVLVTQGGVQDSALAVQPGGRASAALGTALATILLGIVGISFEPKTAETRAAAWHAAPVIEQGAALAVPAALYDRFVAHADPATLETDTVRGLNGAIKALLATSRGDTRAEKDDLASKLADLAIRYEMAHGADAASTWIRYAVLTAACSPSEIATFQSRVKTAGWQTTIDRVPASLRDVLLPIAKTAAMKILNVDRLSGEIPWAKLSDEAPTQGADYIYTHTLACIVRILSAASETDTASRLQTTSLD